MTGTKDRKGLYKHLADAYESGSFLITITVRKGKTLYHEYFMEDFSKDDAVPSMEVMQRLFRELEGEGNFK